jgi:hypothetical protein
MPVDMTVYEQLGMVSKWCESERRNLPGREKQASQADPERARRIAPSLAKLPELPSR